MSEKKTADWQSIRRQFNDWSKSGLIALIKDLYEASPDNRDFLHARFEADENACAALEKYRRKIVSKFLPVRGFGTPKLAEARKAIRDYRKATGNLEGVIDLMLTYIESGNEFTYQFGDINASFYSSLEAVLYEMAQLLKGEGREFYPKFRERIKHLTDHANRIGWGYGDALLDQVDQLENELAVE